MKYFISYSRSVQDNVREIIASLRDGGEEVWWDQDLRAGQDWWGTILNTIEWCDVCLFMVSEKSVQSPYCMDELRYALARNRLVLPYVMDGPVSYTIPDEIMKGRVQYEAYSGRPDHIRDRIKITCQRVDWGQYKDRYASRPPEPNTGTTNLIDRLDKAVTLANEGHFDEAVKRFNDVSHNDYVNFGEFCHRWIEKINRYKEVANMANRVSVRALAAPKWQTFVQLYQNEEFFDPLNVGAKLRNAGGTPPPMPIPGQTDRLNPPMSGRTGQLTGSGQPPDPRPPTQPNRSPSAQTQTAKEHFLHAYNLPNHEQKIKAYSEAIRLNPQYIDAYYNRGNSYYALGQIDYALGDYTHTIQLNPQYAMAYDNRGNCYKTKGEFDRAIADHSEAIRLSPQYAMAYYNRANSYYAKKEYERAISDYSDAIRLNPQYADAYVGRGNSFYTRMDYERAIADYEAALRIDPQHARAAKNRQLAYEGKKKQAR